MTSVAFGVGRDSVAKALAKIPFKGRSVRTTEEREGINPSPTEKNVGEGVIPARGLLSFASASSGTPRFEGFGRSLVWAPDAAPDSDAVNGRGARVGRVIGGNVT
jgi:hypothetical protein